eukprot:m51a1_g5466 hypothetical protein (200) ;mRNA; f:272121-272951
MSSFNLTERFKEGVALINAADAAQLPALLARVLRGLDGTAAPAPSAAELEALSAALGLPAPSAAALVECCTYIVEHAAYYAFAPQALAEALAQAAVAEDRAAAFAAAWRAGAQGVLEHVRSQSFAPLTLDAVHWRLHLQMSQTDSDKVNVPTSIWQFNLADDTVEDGGSKQFVLEMNKEELSKLYIKLEKIQDQLDNLN